MNGLRRRGVDGLTSQEDGTETWTDEQLLARATELGRVLVSQDADLLRIAEEHLQCADAFSGLIYCHQLGAGIGDLVRDLELVAKCCSPQECANSVLFLPLS
jgi:hypothetical protein